MSAPAHEPQAIGVADAVRFLLELCVVAALAYWAVALDAPLVVRVVLALGLPVLVGLVWGRYVAPKAAHPLPLRRRLVVEVVIFAAGVAALVAAGVWILGVALAAAYVLDTAVLLRRPSG